MPSCVLVFAGSHKCKVVDLFFMDSTLSSENPTMIFSSFVFIYFFIVDEVKVFYNCNMNNLVSLLLLAPALASAQDFWGTEDGFAW